VHVQIASIGSSLAEAETLRYRDATSLDDFDAVVWNPRALVDEYDAERGDDGALSVGASQAFLDDLRRRRAALRALVRRGGTLVIEPPPPIAIRVHTLEAILTVPLTQALPVEGIATAAASPRALRFAGGAPFRGFWDAVGSALAPAVRVSAPGGEPLLRDADGGDVFGLYWSQHRGRVLFLPPPQPSARTAYEAALVRMLEALAGDVEEQMPGWARRVVARDEQPVRARFDALEATRAALEREIAATRRALHPLERRKRLFTAAGRSLVEAVSEAFWSLDCSVLQGPFGDADLVIERGEAVSLAWVVAGTGPVGPEALAQLDHGVAHLSARERRPIRGLLIVNPHRGVAPERRPALAESLVADALRRGHRVVTGLDLFGLVVMAAEAPARRDALLENLLGGAGLWSSDLAAWRTTGG
jgi:hypothetical protein